MKFKIMRDYIVDYNVIHTMTSKIMNFMQYFQKKIKSIIFHIFS